MHRQTKTAKRAIALSGASLFSLYMISLGAAGCSNESEQPANASPDQIVRVDTYEDILGIVATLPEAGKPGSEFKIHHEHIPGFKTRDGEVFVTADGVPGMKSMVMAFPLGDAVTLDGLEQGDKVRFSFDVNWGGAPPWVVTEIEEIDADTVINFANKVDGMTSTAASKDDPHAGHDHGDESDHDHSGHDHDGP